MARSTSKASGRVGQHTPEERGDADRSAPAPGTRIGRYWLTQLVGAGGMGRVYAAYDPELDRIVALKLLRSVGRGAAEHRARLQREAQALARLSHPNVVPIFDVGSSAPWLFIAMELIDGPDLRRWLAAGERDWPEVLAVFQGAGEGLAAAHEAGLVHRDFKPGNVVVDVEGRARVLDFGLVRMDESLEGSARGPTETVQPRLPDGALADELTEHGTVVGTPLYMAPEQHRGQGADARSDQFSFCMSLYEALYGRRPYQGYGPHLLEQKEREPTPPPKHAEVPRQIWPVLRRGLSPDPRHRWPSMTTLLDALASSATLASGRRLRRVAWFGTLGLLVVAGGVGWRMHEPPSRCDPSRTELSRVWNAERAETLHDALTGLDVAWATSTWSSVRAALDGFAESWAAGYVDACTDATDTALLDRRMGCLRDQLETADALVTVLGDPSTSALEHAAFATAQLPSPRDCVAPVRTQPSVPELRSRLANARALGQAGRHAEALEAARALESAARATGDRDLGLEAALLVARTTRTLGEHEDAGERLREVAWAAVAAGRDDIGAEAAVAMASLLVFDNALDDAETWLRHAETSLRRATPHAETRARLLQAQGDLLTHKGRLEEALARHAEAASLLATELQADDLRVMDAIAETASLQTRLGRFEEAARSLERIVDAYEAQLGAAHPALATPLGKLAGVRYAQRRFEEALVLTERALQIDEQVHGPGHHRVTRRRSHLGLLLHELKRHDEALALLKQVHQATRAEHGPDHPEVAQALYNVGHVLLGMGENDEAVAWFERSLAVWETVAGAGHLDLAYPLASLGEARFRMGRAAEAIEPLERALEVLDVEEAALRMSVTALLAQALWDADEDRGRALALAAEAHGSIAALGPAGADRLRALERWYARIGRSPPGEAERTVTE